ncbi:hypothetical protein BaRGS_00033782 [Batillaria attramentaria]|uniref:EGF-like domain-containing protein n=1 Tax=Batillaria attramentaria TaxID=370345 RepID=A0ABD0JJ69_9CAEN
MQSNVLGVSFVLMVSSLLKIGQAREFIPGCEFESSDKSRPCYFYAMYPRANVDEADKLCRENYPRGRLAEPRNVQDFHYLYKWTDWCRRGGDGISYFLFGYACLHYSLDECVYYSTGDPISSDLLRTVKQFFTDKGRARMPYACLAASHRGGIHWADCRAAGYYFVCQYNETGSQCGPGSTLCKNGATCIPTCSGERCECLPGFTGLWCESEIDECSSRPCENGGLCRNHINKYMCDCKRGYYGPACRSVVNACSSAPCKNSGQCTQANLTNYFACTCPEGITGTVCENEIPGELSHNCTFWTVEFQDLKCSCLIGKFGQPRAIVGWNLHGNDSHLSPTLLVKSVRRQFARKPRTFTCQMIWVRPGYKKEIKTIRYELSLAYGPTDDDTAIIGRSTVNTNGCKEVKLICKSLDANPAPHAQWEGVTCKEGNKEVTCTFRPDPTTIAGNMINVKCTLVNPVSRDLRASTGLNITVIWEGKAKVTDLQVEGSDHNYVTHVPSQRLRLLCVAIGDPLPDVLYLFLVAGRNTSLKAGGRRLVGAKSAQLQNRSALAINYTIFSPALCGGVDTYRCYTINDEANDSALVAVGTKCTAAASTTAILIAGPVIGSALGLTALLAIAIVAWRRRRRKRQKSQTAMNTLGHLHAVHVSEMQRTLELQDMADTELDGKEEDQAGVPAETEASGVSGTEDSGESIRTADILSSGLEPLSTALGENDDSVAKSQGGDNL